jgi:hypothetical protein
MKSHKRVQLVCVEKIITLPTIVSMTGPALMQLAAFLPLRCCITVGWGTQFRVNECKPCVQYKYRPLGLKLWIRSKYTTAFRGVKVQTAGIVA